MHLPIAVTLGSSMGIVAVALIVLTSFVRDPSFAEDLELSTAVLCLLGIGITSLVIACVQGPIGLSMYVGSVVIGLMISLAVARPVQTIAHSIMRRRASSVSATARTS